MDGVLRANVEATTATEAVGGEHLAGNTAFDGIEGTGADAGVALGAAVMVNVYAKDAQSFKKPTQQTEGADELTEWAVEAE